MKKPNRLDYIMFAFYVLLLLIILVSTQIHPAPPDITYQVISTRDTGSPMYIIDTRTNTTYYVYENGNRFRVVGTE